MIFIIIIIIIQILYVYLIIYRPTLQLNLTSTSTGYYITFSNMFVLKTYGKSAVSFQCLHFLGFCKFYRSKG